MDILKDVGKKSLRAAPESQTLLVVLPRATPERFQGDLGAVFSFDGKCQREGATNPKIILKNTANG